MTSLLETIIYYLIGAAIAITILMLMYQWYISYLDKRSLLMGYTNDTIWPDKIRMLYLGALSVEDIDALETQAHIEPYSNLADDDLLSMDDNFKHQWTQIADMTEYSGYTDSEKNKQRKIYARLLMQLCMDMDKREAFLERTMESQKVLVNHSDELFEAAASEDNDLKAMGLHKKASREKRNETFERLYYNKLLKVVPTITATDNGYLFTDKALGNITFYPKANKIHIHKDNRWLSNGLIWLIKHYNLDKA